MVVGTPEDRIARRWAQVLARRHPGTRWQVERPDRGDVASAPEPSSPPAEAAES